MAANPRQYQLAGDALRTDVEAIMMTPDSVTEPLAAVKSPAAGIRGGVL
jgi:hypothetical protein